MKLLVTALWPERYVIELRTTFPTVEFTSEQTHVEIVSAVTEAEIIFGRLPREAFLAARKLRWIQYHGSGVDWMAQIPELIESDVVVTNTRGAHAATVAEHAFGMLVCLARGFFSIFKAQQQKAWIRPPEKPTVGLSGLTLGIIGLGHVGRTIAQYGRAFKMNVIAVNAHHMPHLDYVSEFWLMEEMSELLQRADVVVVAVPFTPKTRGLIGADQLALMKPSAYLLAVSRGGIVDEQALAQALREGRLAGAGLDVQEQEPLPLESELWDAPNIIITPHCSAASQQTATQVMDICQDNLSRFIAGKPLINLVDKKRGY